MTSYGDRPEIMAIGDSMYQGVRSLTWTADLARTSAPAQVAAALGLAMTVPNPRVPILYDLEELFRQGGLLHLLAAARNSCLANLRFWLSGEAWSQHEAFDNVAIGSADIGQLYTDSYATMWPQVQRLANELQTNPSPDPALIGSLWYALNVCFTLNPQRHPTGQAGKSQLAQVKDRQPRLLLVNIGSNEGLFRAAFSGAFDAATLASVKAIPSKMQALADQLTGLPATTTILFNALVRPRTASNLMTRENFPGWPGDGYFDFYVPRIGNGVDRIPGAVVKDFDALIAGVNDEVRKIMETTLKGKVKWVDLYAASNAHDGKHYQDRYLEVQPDGDFHRLRNVPIDAPMGTLNFGGMTGLDNMHPTVPGYAVIADAVLAQIDPSKSTDKDEAFKRDTLLNDLPFNLSVSQLELGLLGSLGVFSGGGGLTTAPAEAAVVA